MSTLAIKGGAPVRTKPFPSWPYFDEQEEQALLKVLRSGNWWQFAYGTGVELDEGGEKEDDAQVSRFQEEFAAAHDCACGVAAANGTVTLELILRALGIGPGDEVIVPPYTFIASASSILSAGAVPIFVDVTADTLNLDPARIEEAITPRTRAILPVHFGGQSADMDAINTIAQKYELYVVEDAAHAHGASWNGRKCGSLSDAASFSFQNSKNITAGEGGIITTNNRELAERCSSLLWAGREPGRPWYEHHRLGSNYRLTEFQGAILRVQLRRLTEQTARRDANGRYLAEKLRGSGLEPTRLDERADIISFHLFMSRYQPEAFGGMPREQFLEALTAEGIPCSGGYNHALYQNPMFLNKDFWKGSFPCVAPYAREIDYADFAALCPVSEAVCKDAVWFTQNMLLAERKDMDDIVEAVTKIKGNAK
ncbi:MAG: DegT/DnrJ/EryC1/StrS family aminotransferase [Armatimonadota bacterium]